MGFGENMPLDVLFVRDDDIPDLVQEDVCDLGLVGLNVLEERRLELASRGAVARFERCATWILAAAGSPSRCPRHRLRGPGIAPGQAHRDHLSFLLDQFLKRQLIGAEIVTLSGAVEIAPRLGRADLICDLVSSGSTLQANHLREVYTVLESHAVLIRTPVSLPATKSEWSRAAAAHRRRGAGQGEQVTSCCTRHGRAPRDPQPAAGERVADDHSLEGHPDRVVVHAVCRENVFWETSRA